MSNHRDNIKKIQDTLQKASMSFESHKASNYRAQKETKRKTAKNIIKLQSDKELPFLNLNFQIGVCNF